VGGDSLDAANDAVRVTLSEEQRAEERYLPDNYDAWNEFFRRRLERELAAYDCPPSPSARNNAVGRRWWSAPGRALASVLTHIEDDAVSACRPFFNFNLCFHLAEFKYIMDLAYICMNSPMYVKNISKFLLCLNVFCLVLFEFAYICLNFTS
jgi:hypothetical protein